MKYTIMVTRVLLWLTNQNTKTLDAPIPFRPGLKKLVAITGWLYPWGRMAGFHCK